MRRLGWLPGRPGLENAFRRKCAEWNLISSYIQTSHFTPLVLVVSIEGMRNKRGENEIKQTYKKHHCFIKPYHLSMKSSATALAIKKPRSLKITKATIVEAISSLLILLFVYAAVSKLLDYETFKIQLSKSPFISPFAKMTAWALPVGEILLALALTSKRTRLIGLYASLFLMTMFTAYIYTMLRYSYYIPCSCGGILSKMGWHEHLWFNLGFVVLSIIGILLVTLAPEKPAQGTEPPPVIFT